MKSKTPITITIIQFISLIICVGYLLSLIMNISIIQNVLAGNHTTPQDHSITGIMNGLDEIAIIMMLFIGIFSFIPSILIYVSTKIRKKIVTLFTCIINSFSVVIFLYLFTNNASINWIFLIFPLSHLSLVCMILSQWNWLSKTTPISKY